MKRHERIVHRLLLLLISLSWIVVGVSLKSWRDKKRKVQAGRKGGKNKNITCFPRCDPDRRSRPIQDWKVLESWGYYSDWSDHRPNRNPSLDTLNLSKKFDVHSPWIREVGWSYDHRNSCCVQGGSGFERVNVFDPEHHSRDYLLKTGLISRLKKKIWSDDLVSGSDPL